MINLYAPEQAIAFYKASLDVDPRYDANRGDIARTSLLLGRRDDAAREVATMPSDPVGLSARAMLAEFDVVNGHAAPSPLASSSVGDYLTPSTRYARALLHARRLDLARPLISSILRAAPGFCEARAVEVGELRLRRSAEATRAAAKAASLTEGADPSG